MKNKVRAFIEAWVEIIDEDLTDDDREYYIQFPKVNIKQEVTHYMKNGGFVEISIKKELKRILDRYEKKLLLDNGK